MDVLNQLLAQMNSVYRSLSVGARIVVTLLLAVVVIGTAYLFNNQLTPPNSFLFGGEAVSSSEIGAIEAAFGKAGLKNYVLEGNRIRVPQGEASTYMAALADANALPANALSYIKKSLDDGGFWESKSKQSERLKYGMQMELTQLISKMQGIESGSVLYDIKEEGGLTRRKIYSASVGVKTIGGVALEEERVQAIRHLVAAAFAGMQPESVAVTDLANNRVYPAGRAGEVASGSLDPYNQTKLAHERNWHEKIRQALAYVPGAVVAVNVQLNPQLEETERKTSLDSKTILLTQQENSETSTQVLPANTGRPGLAAQGGVSNAPQSLAAAASAAGRNEKEISTVNNRYATPGSDTVIKRAPLTPSVVTVSIGVPASYYEKLWQQQNPPAAGQPARKPTINELNQIETTERTKIVNFVRKLLPYKEGVDPDKDTTNLVQVTMFHDLPQAEIPAPELSATALSWLEKNWSSLGTGFLGLMGLVMLRSLVRGIPTPPAPPEPEPAPAAASAANPTGETPAGGDPAANPANQVKRLLRRNKSGNSLREELVEIVREDPDTAANVLRSWISGP
ncbi:MAG: hypothetical protein SFX18_05250 [Pirellulales bacterium]|nr:hypothetical protein [Pirellulales bacterium]